ncbi:MAG TPA: DUF3822 family protein [Saprospiraceae bacterium]|nr:DUF3822 family protein [Saprospiraceae bacterium]HMV24324.1 DUF3822 family protein [Saprospiraceae bacterium]HMX83050.1 DUF3822 family protein [Saprospiraceae bacterium]HMX85420.1 DUF3822 family protein [Saprospiraceae bacterium]HMZ72899.1 DUF3822 family protein [Saprospiraceae bacterium]
MTDEKLHILPFLAEDLDGADLFVGIEKTNLKLAVVNRVKNLSHILNFALNSGSAIENILPFNIRELNRCRKVSISLALDKFVIVPASFFDTRAATDYLDQAYEIDRSEKVRYKLIKTMNAFMVYQQNEYFNKLVNIFPKTEIVLPEVDSFVQYINNNKERVDLYLHFHNRSFILYLIIDNSVQFVQHYSFYEASDAVYYILNVLSCFKVDPAAIKAVVSGNIMPYSDLYNTIYRFIGQVEWFNTSDSPLFAGQGFVENSHTIADLHCLALCV